MGFLSYSSCGGPVCSAWGPSEPGPLLCEAYSCPHTHKPAVKQGHQNSKLHIKLTHRAVLYFSVIPLPRASAESPMAAVLQNPADLLFLVLISLDSHPSFSESDLFFMLIFP